MHLNTNTEVLGADPGTDDPKVVDLPQTQANIGSSAEGWRGVGGPGSQTPQQNNLQNSAKILQLKVEVGLRKGVFTLVTASCFFDVDCSFFDVNLKI